MDQPLGMGGREPVAHLVRQLEEPRKRERMLRGDDFERAPVHELHDDERPVLVRVEIENGDDVRVVQRREDRRFLPDGRLDLGVFVDALDRDVPTKLHVPSPKNTPTATFANGILYFVASRYRILIVAHTVTFQSNNPMAT